MLVRQAAAAGRQLTRHYGTSVLPATIISAAAAGPGRRPVGKVQQVAQTRQLWWSRPPAPQAQPPQPPQQQQQQEPQQPVIQSVPIDFDVQATIKGHETQVLTVDLQEGQRLRAEAGNLVYMTEGVQMDTNMAGGMGKTFSRIITGQNLMVTDFYMEGPGTGQVCLGASMPAKILRLPLADYGGSVVCQRGAFLAGSDTIDITMAVTRPMAGLFGGEGFVLQRLGGSGDAFVSAFGHVMQKDLAPGETLRVSAGCVVAFAGTVEYDVTSAGGFKNVVFGTEGIFLASFKGPGAVFLQGLPFDRMVRTIGKALQVGGAAGMPMVPPIFIPGGGGGGSDGGAGGGGGGGGGAAAGAAAGAGADIGAHSTPAGMHPIDVHDAAAQQSVSDLYGDSAPSPDDIVDSELDLDLDDFDWDD